MPSLTTAVSPASSTTRAVAGGETTITSYSIATSKIVRTAVAAGVIVLILSGLVLFFKISSWIRYHQRIRRQDYLTANIQSDRRTNEYEIAAWADEPGKAPVTLGFSSKDEKKREKKVRKEKLKAQRRGGANAFAVHEWEGQAL